MKGVDDVLKLRIPYSSSILLSHKRTKEHICFLSHCWVWIRVNLHVDARYVSRCVSVQCSVFSVDVVPSAYSLLMANRFNALWTDWIGLNIECMWYLAVFHFHAGYWIFVFFDSIIYLIFRDHCAVPLPFCVALSGYILWIHHLHKPIFCQSNRTLILPPIGVSRTSCVQCKKYTNWITATTSEKKETTPIIINSQMETNSFNGIVSSFEFVHETSQEIENDNKISLDGLGYCM